ncbi:hypothetical protein ARMSODRAFT_1024454 [Armillaria solidipes]|uniref:Uncharacterized protein n=1 Tax=Armillaria solidipes TaxID=1076256 RepID=A0A2H3BGF6_9AGAR|nr:hypothetical protein ARMSODRAFT_1024454 [Armillaria solidipes]
MSAYHGMCSAIEKIIKDLNRISDVVFLDLDFFGLQWTKYMLRAYVWIANSITQSVTQLKDWHFDSNAPRDIGNLVWRPKANSSAKNLRKRSGRGRRLSGSDSDSDSEEFDASDECIVNDYKVPYYTASELICLHEDSGEATSEARERMRARQGEMPSDFVMRRYLDSLQTDVDDV